MRPRDCDFPLAMASELHVSTRGAVTSQAVLSRDRNLNVIGPTLSRPRKKGRKQAENHIFHQFQVAHNPPIQQRLQKRLWFCFPSVATIQLLDWKSLHLIVDLEHDRYLATTGVATAHVQVVDI